MDNNYKRQVSLLLRILPEIDKFKDFALHGGTAINLFYNEMPRLSVDIDLTWIPYGERKQDLELINFQLKQLSQQLKSRIEGIKVIEPVNIDDNYKLVCFHNGIVVKIEVNTVNRGLISPPQIKTLCEKAQNEFESYNEIQVVPLGQLYGGKVVAALDRQHPRDIFDVWKMFDNIGYTPEIHKGFMFCILSSPKPMHELLNPKLKDQQSSFNNQFSGMTDEPFSYIDYEKTRKKLIAWIKTSLTTNDKKLLLSFANGEPEWPHLENYGDYPGIKWKLLNIKSLMRTNKVKHKKFQDELQAILNKTV